MCNLGILVKKSEFWKNTETKSPECALLSGDLGYTLNNKEVAHLLVSQKKSCVTVICVEHLAIFKLLSGGQELKERR